MEFHPLSEIWPLMEGKDFDAFVEDIRLHGQRLPILVYQDKVLEGRNRDRACTQLGIAARYEPAPIDNDNDALDLVISLNEKRRHLTTGQRAMVGKKIATIKRGFNRFSDRSRNSAIYTQDAVAERLNIHSSAIRIAKVVCDNASPEVIKAVEQGSMTLHAAKKTFDRPTRSKTPKPPGQRKETKEERDWRIMQGRSDRNATARNLTPAQVDPDFVGTPLDFATKYGHVHLKTAAEMAEETLAINRSKWLGALRELHGTVQAFDDATAAVDRGTLRQRIQAKEKLQGQVNEVIMLLEKAASFLREVHQ